MIKLNTHSLTAKIWIGCQSCYVSGRLVGDWVALEDMQTHTGTCVKCGSDELVSMDSELVPFTGEYSIKQWIEIAETLESIARDSDPQAFLAYVSGIMGTSYALQDLDNARSEFEGTIYHVLESGDTLAGWAEDLMNELGYFNAETMDTLIARNIDWAGVADDLMNDYTLVEFDGLRWIFCNN